MLDAPTGRLDSRPFTVESNGLDVIGERERKGSPRSLFWPWFYGDIRVLPLVTTLAGTALGWGLVTNTAAGRLNWQGYLLHPLGLGGKTGAWAAADLGVPAALALGFVVTPALSRGRIREQERQPNPTPTTAQTETDEAVLPA